jgi:hypothetical protein
MLFWALSKVIFKQTNANYKNTIVFCQKSKVFRGKTIVCCQETIVVLKETKVF